MSSSAIRTVPRDPDPKRQPRSGSLPRPLTPLLGREEDIRAVSELLGTDGVQIVTLVGPGGIGKTRLAIEVARRERGRYPDGVRFIELAPVREGSLVPAAIAQVLDIRDLQGQALVDRIEAVAGDRRILLLIDNLEHVVESAPFLSRIAERCPLVQFLCTSRSRLGISGEHVFSTPPLSLDAAVTLFAQRARALAPEITITDDSAGIVREVCARLDGLPLAIELAAARVLVLSPRELLRGLDDRFAVLAHGLRDMPERHRDLRTAIDWSYGLLDPVAQRLFRSLAVFPGGFTLDAAMAVTDDGAGALDGLGRLEASSLVRRVPSHDDRARFTMLETLREFAWERLVERGEDHRLGQTHAAFFVHLVNGTDRLWWVPEGMSRLNHLEAELPNVRTALRWLKDAGEIEDFLKIAGALAALWASRGYSQEGRSYLEWGLAHSDGVSPEVVLVATWALSWILNQHDEGFRALVTGQHALSIAEEADDPMRFVGCLSVSGVAAFRYGLFERSIAFHQRILRVCEAHHDDAWTHVASCIAMNQLGLVNLHLGRLDLAESWYTRALTDKQRYQLTFTHGSHSLLGLGDVARARGDAALALERYQAALPFMREARDLRARAYVVAAIAGTLAAVGQFELAGELFGASEAEHERIAFTFTTHTWERQRALGLPEPWAEAGVSHGIHETLHQSLERRTAEIRAIRLDPALCRAWWNAGRSMSFEEALEMALAVTPAPPSPLEPPGGLSPREIDVLTLLARGLTDEEIAQRLSISRRTASNHAHHIYTKLDLGSRAEATAWAVRQGLA